MSLVATRRRRIRRGLQTLYELRLAGQKTGNAIRTLPTLTPHGKNLDDLQPRPA